MICFDITAEISRQYSSISILGSKDGVNVELEINTCPATPQKPKYVVLRGYSGPIEFQKLHSVQVTLPYLCSGSPIISSTFIREIGERAKFIKTPELQKLEFPLARSYHVHLEIKFSEGCDCMENPQCVDSCWFKEEKFSDVSVICADGSSFPVSFPV